MAKTRAKKVDRKEGAEARREAAEATVAVSEKGAKRAAGKGNEQQKKASRAENERRVAPQPRKEPFGKRVKTFFKGVSAELRKVQWPGRQELIVFTTVVIVSVLVIAAGIWVVDSGLTQLVSLLLRK